MWSLKTVVLYMCAHAGLAHNHFRKTWLCNVLKIIKGWALCFLEGVDQQGHEIEQSTHLRALLPFPLFHLLFLVSHDYEKLNYLLLGLDYQTLFDVIIFTIHIMLFQYYCFLSKFISLFMIWPFIHMYVTGFKSLKNIFTLRT